MGSFDSSASTKAAASNKSSHADQIEGAAPAAARTTPTYTPGHAPNAAQPNALGSDRAGARFADATSFTPATTSSPDDFFTIPDPARSPFLNPPSARAPIQPPVQGTPTLPAPPALPSRPGPLEDFGGAGRQVTPTPPRLSGQHPVQPVNTGEGGGNAPENAALLEKRNSARQKQAQAQQRQQRDHDAEREKRTRAEIASGARMAKFQAARPARVGKLMEPQDHPGLSDAAIAAHDRQVRALGKIRGVGDLPVITRDAATNYGDKGLYEVGDLIYRTIKADPEQGRELLDQTTAGMDSDRAQRLQATVASLQMHDAPMAAAKLTEAKTEDAGNLSGSQGDEVLSGGDWDDGLTPYERNKRLFPGFDDEEKPNTYEYLKRKATDSRTSVTRDMPPYKSPDTPPQSDKGLINDYIHRMDIDRKVADRIKPDDIETLRLLERFRQLDSAGTKKLENRLSDLRERDLQLFNALNGKRTVAHVNAGWALWSMSDKELKESIEHIQRTEPIAHASDFIGDVTNTIGKAARGLYPDPVSTLSPEIREKMGVIENETERTTKPYRLELDRRRQWQDQR